MLILLALWSESNDDEREINALEDEVARLRQAMSAEERNFVGQVASQEGYVLPNGFVEEAKPSLGDGDLIPAPVPAPAPESNSNLPFSGLASGKDPVEAMFSIMSMLFPLMGLMFILIMVKSIFRDR